MTDSRSRYSRVFPGYCGRTLILDRWEKNIVRYVVTMASRLTVPSATVATHDERSARIVMAAVAAGCSSLIVIEGARVPEAV